MNIAKRDLKLILILLSIIVFLAGYFGIYTNYTDKTTAVEAELTVLEPRLQELQGYYQNLNVYTEGIEDGKEIISDELNKYPNDMRSEDKIMYAVALEDNIGIKISTATFNTSELAMELRGIVADATDVYTPTPLSAYRSTMGISCELNYQELKDSINFINTTDKNTKLELVSVSYNSESGELIGTMNIAKYFITGADSEYHETEVPDIEFGTDNIFGTITTR